MSKLGKFLALGLAIESLDTLAIARAAADLLLDFVPADVLKQNMDEFARLRAEVVADVAEDAKFGPP